MKNVDIYGYKDKNGKETDAMTKQQMYHERHNAKKKKNLKSTIKIICKS